MIEELSISDRLCLLGLAKEAKAVIFMCKEEANGNGKEVSIERYVEEVIEIAERMAEWVMKNGEEVVKVVVIDGKRKTVDARGQLKMLGFRWNAKEKA